MFDVDDQVGSQIGASQSGISTRKSRALLKKKQKKKALEDRETFKQRMISEMKGKPLSQQDSKKNNSESQDSINSLEEKDKNEDDSCQESEEFDEVPALPSQDESQIGKKIRNRSFKRMSTEFVLPAKPLPQLNISPEKEKAHSNKLKSMKTQNSNSSKYTMFANTRTQTVDE